MWKAYIQDLISGIKGITAVHNQIIVTEKMTENI